MNTEVVQVCQLRLNDYFIQGGLIFRVVGIDEHVINYRRFDHTCKYKTSGVKYQKGIHATAKVERLKSEPDINYEGR